MSVDKKELIKFDKIVHYLFIGFWPSLISALFLLLFLSLLLPTTFLEAQDTEGEKNATAPTEDEIREQQQQNYLLNLIVYSDDLAEKRLSIQRLGQLVDQGKLKPDDRLTLSALMNLAQQGTIQKSYDTHGNLINDYYLVRADACNLLGKLGGKIARAGLLSIINNDVEPAVVAIAMENLVMVAPEGNPGIIGNIVDTFYKYHYTNRDNSLANSFLLVASKYAASSDGKLLSPFMLQAVHDISLPGNSYMAQLRAKARTLLLGWLGADYPIWNEIK
ncbi:hypothetical protein P0082_02060 [Candidatus Haliotispira prima]|uniref:HEAT repeat domain-containing protein n=1 Tax=Candidatus Haliotispira prima TaxID=3034016 RepID=A0ABY8MJ92_9SPIO|nr:hypothetical protein P0082_02060 [Candidatus Haliotispira prima]